MRERDRRGEGRKCPGRNPQLEEEFRRQYAGNGQPEELVMVVCNLIEETIVGGGGVRIPLFGSLFPVEEFVVAGTNRTHLRREVYTTFRPSKHLRGLLEKIARRHLEKIDPAIMRRISIGGHLGRPVRLREAGGTRYSSTLRQIVKRAYRKE